MSVKHLTKSIEEIKDFVKNFDADFDKTINSLTKQEEEMFALDNKLYSIEVIQSSLITFNVSGKLVEVNKNLFISTLYPNILSELFAKNEQSLEKLKSNIIEMDFNHFQICLDILRKRLNDSSFIFGDYNFVDYVLPTNTDPTVFSGSFSIFFLGNLTQIMKNMNIRYYDKFGQLKAFYVNSEIMENLIQENISKVFLDKLLKCYMAKSINDILSLNSKSAFFIHSESSITFNFGQQVAISEIELKPFELDQTLWFPGDGAGSSIIGKVLEETFKLGRVPGDYGTSSGKVYKIKLEEKKLVNSITIKAGLFGLSIAYINFK